MAHCPQTASPNATPLTCARALIQDSQPTLEALHLFAGNTSECSERPVFPARWLRAAHYYDDKLKEEVLRYMTELDMSGDPDYESGEEGGEGNGDDEEENKEGEVEEGDEDKEYRTLKRAYLELKKFQECFNAAFGVQCSATIEPMLKAALEERRRQKREKRKEAKSTSPSDAAAVPRLCNRRDWFCLFEHWETLSHHTHCGGLWNAEESWEKVQVGLGKLKGTLYRKFRAHMEVVQGRLERALIVVKEGEAVPVAASDTRAKVAESVRIFIDALAASIFLDADGTHLDLKSGNLERTVVVRERLALEEPGEEAIELLPLFCDTFDEFCRKLFRVDDAHFLERLVDAAVDEAQTALWSEKDWEPGVLDGYCNRAAAVLAIANTAVREVEEEEGLKQENGKKRKREVEGHEDEVTKKRKEEGQAEHNNKREKEQGQEVKGRISMIRRNLLRHSRRRLRQAMEELRATVTGFEAIAEGKQLLQRQGNLSSSSRDELDVLVQKCAALLANKKHCSRVFVQNMETLRPVFARLVARACS